MAGRVVKAKPVKAARELRLGVDGALYLDIVSVLGGTAGRASLAARLNYLNDIRGSDGQAFPLPSRLLQVPNHPKAKMDGANVIADCDNVGCGRRRGGCLVPVMGERGHPRSGEARKAKRQPLRPLRLSHHRAIVLIIVGPGAPGKAGGTLNFVSVGLVIPRKLKLDDACCAGHRNNRTR